MPMLLVRRSHFQNFWAKVKVGQRIWLELSGPTVSVFLELWGVGSQGKNLEEEAFSVKTRTALEKWEQVYHPQWRHLNTAPVPQWLHLPNEKFRHSSACFSRCLWESGWYTNVCEILGLKMSYFSNSRGSRWPLEQQGFDFILSLVLWVILGYAFLLLLGVMFSRRAGRFFGPFLLHTSIKLIFLSV